MMMMVMVDGWSDAYFAVLSVELNGIVVIIKFLNVVKVNNCLNIISLSVAITF